MRAVKRTQLQLDEPLHEALAESGSCGISLVDHVSFVVMKARGLERAFAFDADFISHGFDVIGPASSQATGPARGASPR